MAQTAPSTRKAARRTKRLPKAANGGIELLLIHSVDHLGAQGDVVTVKAGESVTEGELRDFVRARLAAFKVPTRVAFLDKPLPRNANGKILKRDLKPLFEDAQ